MQNCPWCNAEARDIFQFTCGSVRPSYVTPSPCQSDKCRIGILKSARNHLLAAIAEHHAQKADDRCVEDDDRLYAAAGLPPCDRRVGDKTAMLANCARFIERRCEGGGWPSYAELEKELAELKSRTCATCRWWLTQHHIERRGVVIHPCGFEHTEIVHFLDEGDVCTTKNFCCNQWEPKQEGE